MRSLLYDLRVVARKAITPSHFLSCVGWLVGPVHLPLSMPTLRMGAALLEVRKSEKGLMCSYRISAPFLNLYGFRDSG